MDDNYNVMQNWMKVAEWREAKREQEEEKRKMFLGCQNVRLSGDHKNRQFFNIDARNEYRRQEQEEQERMKKVKRDFFNIDGRKEYRRQEEERFKMEEEEEEKRKKKEEEQRKEEEEEHQEQSQSLFRMYQEMTKDENRRRKYNNFSKLFRKHSQ